MLRLSSFLTLCVSISSYLANVDAATVSTNCKSEISSMKSISSSASASSPSVNVNVQSSGLGSSASAIISSPRSSSSAVGTASSSVSRSTISNSASSVSRLSTSASSSVPSRSASPSPVSPSATTVSSNECPPYSTSTQTQTLLIYKAGSTENRGTVTITSTTYTATTTSTLSDVRTYTTTEYTSTITTTSTRTSTTSIVVVPASSTTTVPTPANFTPLLCLPDYLDATITVTSTSYFVSTTVEAFVTASTQFSTATTVPEFLPDVTVTVSEPGVYTTTAYDFTQVIATRADPTSTVYAACATNNVSPRGPFKGNSTYNFFYEFPTGLEQTMVAAVDSEDCCAQCQADPSCIVSLSYTTFFSPRLECNLYFKPSNATGSCGPTAFVTNVTTFASESPGFYISNGPCGQVDFADQMFVEFAEV